MRFLILLFAIFGATLASKVAPNDLEEPALALIACFGKALDGGLEAAQLPDHNPFVSWRNLTLPIDILGVTGYAKLNHFEIQDIVKFDITSVEGTLTEDGSEIDYNYALWWDKLVIVSNYTIDISGPLGLGIQTEGDLTISFNGLQAVGIWNMVLDPKYLNAYTVQFITESTEITVTGLDLLDGIINTLAGPLLNTFLNNLDPAPFSNALLDVFNNEWLNEDGLYRIDAVMDNCKEN